jgi:hypothetical protein
MGLVEGKRPRRGTGYGPWRMSRPLPPPLPPESRTVGQVIAESLRLYGQRFWPSLALGLPVAAIDQASAGRSLTTQTLILWAGTPLLTASFVAAVLIASPGRRPLRALLAAWLVGILVFAPVPALVRFFVFPALAWLALFGLAVPVLLIERVGARAALIRARRLGLADYVHALGSLCALGIVYFVTRVMLLLLLHGQADTTTRVAAFVADLVVSLVLFLGSALLYFDQAARVVHSGSRSRRKPDADVHPALDAHGPGRADAEVEP